MSVSSSREFHFIPNEAPLIEIELIPLEEDDLDTIADIEEVGRALRDETTAPEGYTIVEADRQERIDSEKARGGGELFQIVSDLTQIVHDQQDVVKILIGAGLTALGLLLKQRRVKKLEVTLGKKILRVDNADQQAVRTAMQQFETLCREEE